MADSKIPPNFKALLPFIRRAEELERDSTRPESKLIAYYCRQYAMELGIKLRENDSSNESTNYLLALMDRLEEDKSHLPTFTQEEGKEICEDFAIEIFTKADDEDRAGCADKNTARTFYAAGTFFDILNQFGDVSEDLMEKRRYCKYKAATILKAIKEGTVPAPGPPGAGYATTGDGYSGDDSSQQSNGAAARSQPAALPDISSLSISGSSSASSLPAPSDAGFPSFTSSAASFGQVYSPPPPTQAQAYTPPQQAPPQQQPVYTPPPPPPQPVAAPAPIAFPPPAPTHTPYVPQTLPSRGRAGPVTQNEINDAMECAKFAVAALKVKDIELAIQRLEMALKSIK